MKDLYFSLLLCGYFLCSSGDGGLDVTNGLDPNGNNVCSYRDQVSKKVQISFLQQKLTTKAVQTCCTWFCVRYCQKNITITKEYVSYRLTTKYFDRNNYHCCSGWMRSGKNADSCSTPICNINCRNGGKCVAPDTCKCSPGFKGKYCQLDKDECNDASKNSCEQICVNMNGGFKCACKRGYTLNPDKQTCQDKDECSSVNPPCGCANTDGVCAASCVNTPGSYQCNCSAGYQLNSAQKCEDINECFLNANLCDQQCVNTPGSYRCACAKGFRFNGKKCIDIDECAVKNGGCSDKCHNLEGGYVCSCPDKFYLTKDRRTCQVIKPTMKHKIICESEQLGFLNCDKYDEKIIIIDAMYGRLSKDYCQKNNYTQNLRCQADNPLQHLQTCNNKSSCVFFFQKDVFGDPCPGIEKYMQITFDCLK